MRKQRFKLAWNGYNNSRSFLNVGKKKDKKKKKKEKAQRMKGKGNKRNIGMSFWRRVCRNSKVNWKIIVGRMVPRYEASGSRFEDTISAWILLNGSNLINAMRDDSRDYIRSYLFIYSNRGRGRNVGKSWFNFLWYTRYISYSRKGSCFGLSLKMEEEIPRIILWGL